MIRFLTTASAVTMAFALFPAAVAAQEAAQIEKAGSNNEASVDEIIVTAQRRNERLQDVPVSVSALSADFISENQVRTFQDLGASVPEIGRAHV